MEIQVEKGIPIPEPGRRKRGERLYPFREMEIGDSFVVEKNGRKSWSFIFTQITEAQKVHNIKLTSRTTDDGTKIRVWRTA